MFRFAQHDTPSGSDTRVFSLLIATRNAHKTREIAALLGSEFAITDMTAAHHLEPVEETGQTFEENAVLKATVVSDVVSGLVVADDSGLEVDSLGGAPGVYSARYAGEDATDDANVAKLLAALDGRIDRAAQFRCVLALARAGETLAVFDGIVRGSIALSPSGSRGFGYDPIFVPDGYDKSFSALGTSVKNAISHRARAVIQLRDYLIDNKKGGDERRP
jgi:XTP/dITP diphosphohydrolase